MLGMWRLGTRKWTKHRWLAQFAVFRWFYTAGLIARRLRCGMRVLIASCLFRWGCEGDDIRCKYHGLKIGSDGHAVEMPIRTDPVNKSICVETFIVEERYRFIWVWSVIRKGEPELIPNLWPCAAEGWTFDGSYYQIDCDYRLMVDNLMDLTHETTFMLVPSGSLKSWRHRSRRELRAIMSLCRDGCLASTHPFWRSALRKDGLVDRWQICQFLLPSAVMIDVGVAQANTGTTLENHDQVCAV
jgi:vanillate O-demethylase monooxygenase subunit